MPSRKENFKPLFRSSPFLDLLGPIYQCRARKDLIIGLEIADKHCNARQSVHGGVISTLADIALGYNTAFSEETPIPLATVQLSIDYMGKVVRGDWLEVRTEVQKVGRKLAFANCIFTVGEKRVAKASAIFSVVNKG